MKPKKLVHGVGINDADYAVVEFETIIVNGKQKRKLIWFCPFYRTWTKMLGRCYSIKTQECRPTYTGCSVVTEWLTFSNFRAWMEKQNFVDKQLDKDLLIEGNKVYSPDACVFVTSMANSFIIDSGASRGDWLIGVTWHKPTEKFISRCSNPFTKKREHLGYFDCEHEAHESWLKRKLELAYELAAIQEDTRVAEALINRYSNYNPNN